MAPSSTSIECVQQMNNVLSVLRKALLTKVYPATEPVEIPSLSNIQLPPAPCIATTLMAYDIPQSVSRDLIDTYEHRISDLRHCTEAQIRKVMDFLGNRKCPPRVIEKHIARYFADYQSRANHWHHLVIERLQNSSALATDAKHERSTFNATHVPLLEKYLSYNAFPQTNDKLWLARKTGNTPRQIEIWFQNRRRRSRKAGVELKRAILDDIPLDIRFGDFDEDSSPSRAGKRKRVARSQNTSTPQSPPPSLIPQQPDEPQARCDFTDFELSPHAFPSKYTPSSTQSACSGSTDFRFSEPEWTRKPAEQRTRSRKQTIPSEDDLCTMVISKLKLFSKDPSPETGPSWHTTRYTQPSSAPIPALIRLQPLTAPMNPKSLTVTTLPAIKPSLKRKRTEPDTEECPVNKRRSISSSSFTSTSSTSNDDSSCESSSPGPRTPPSTLLSLSYDPISLLPRFIDWSKFKVPVVPRVYGIC
ncbi:hypothetical protein P691DRAFT_800669 [Macrolepiota fuliginosa MF-IS2]|uniref:Homeobox domain-containing protein n=1 Tax=Macrolepiota fuliginosa MF-IS2 TaxID=1400762 RepID=A0A9P5X089_9AGAR|nr:hypothetical protein P691DRAFT_800669 [Macrolepiota fuliginosa MF-IS2]